MRGDADEAGENGGWRVKCQREFVGKAREAMNGGPKGKKRVREDGSAVEIEGTLEDERERK